MSGNIPTVIINPDNNLWTPEKGDYGFRVDMLPESEVKAPLPISEVFSTVEERSQYLINRYNRGEGVRIIDSPTVLAPNEQLLSLQGNVMVASADFQAAEREGKIAPGLLKEIQGEPLDQVDITSEQARQHGFFGVFSQQEAAGTSQLIANALGHQLLPEWAYLPKGMLERQETISQIVQFTSWGKTVKLYNFTSSRLTEETVSKMAYALYEMARRTGGASFGMLDVMAVVPNDDPLLVIEKEKEVDYNLARTEGGAIIFAEAVINPDIPLPESAQKESPEGENPDDIPFHVPGDIVQRAVFHELTHLVAAKGRQRDVALSDRLATDIGWRWEDGQVDNTGKRPPIQRGRQEAPTRYGRFSHLEDIAVTGESSFVGGAWFSQQYDAQRKEAVDTLFRERHSQLQGPTLVTATELPLPSSDHKLGLPDQPIAILTSYGFSIY